MTSRFSRRSLLGGVLATGAAAAASRTLNAQPASPSAAAIASPSRPHRILFFVSDGMSQSVVSLAEMLSRQTRNTGTHWWELLQNPAAELGQMETISADSPVTDSAAASSAWGGGRRVRNGAINITADGSRSPLICDWLRQHGGRLGLVTTATATHATPAGFAAHVANRDQQAEIARQYLERVDLVLGGGIEYFDTRRADGRDLITDFAKAGYEIARTSEELTAAKGARRLGLFSMSHIPYALDLAGNPEQRAKIPSLTQMTANALDWALLDDGPLLLQIEGARIDHAAHANDIAGLLHDQIDFDDALGLGLAFAKEHPDTLVIATSDHGNSNPGLNGMGPSYRKSGDAFARIARAKGSCQGFLERIGHKAGSISADALAGSVEEMFGVELKIAEAESLLAVIRNEPVPVWSHQHANPSGLLGKIIGNHNGIGWTGNSHTNDPTLISAVGPGSHLFRGLVRNDEVKARFEALLST